jgi:hypothetical protein
LTPTEIQLDDLRLRTVGRLSEAQDLFSIIVLTPAALARLRAGHPLNQLIAVVELGAILLAVVAAVRELRREGLQAQLIGVLFQGILERSIMVRLARRGLKALLGRGAGAGARVRAERRPSAGEDVTGEGSIHDEDMGGEPAGIDWVSLFVGLVMLGEAAVRIANGGKTLSPALLAGTTGVILGVGNPWIERLRRRRRWIRLDDIGVRGRLSRLRRLEVRWNELAAVEAEQRTLRFLRVDGGVRTLQLGRYGNRDAVRTAVLRAAKTMGVTVR